MGMEWDPEGDAERRKDSRKRWLLTLAVLGGIAMVTKNVVSSYLRERERKQQNEEIMKWQRINEQSYSPSYR